jgi:hypothetical protein
MDANKNQKSVSTFGKPSVKAQIEKNISSAPVNSDALVSPRATRSSGSERTTFK